MKTLSKTEKKKIYGYGDTDLEGRLRYIGKKAPPGVKRGDGVRLVFNNEGFFRIVYPNGVKTDWRWGGNRSGRRTIRTNFKAKREMLGRHVN